MTLHQDKKDRIINALTVGMALSDAYIYAGVTPNEVLLLDEDPDFQREVGQLTRTVEFRLLDQMRTIADKQVRMGKETAVTWLLEKLYPRYSNKPQDTTGEVHLHFNNVDPKDYDNVQIFSPTPLMPSTEIESRETQKAIDAQIEAEEN